MNINIIRVESLENYWINRWNHHRALFNVPSMGGIVEK